MKAELRERQRRRGERETEERFEELALKMEKGGMSQEIQVASGSWQRLGNEFSPSEEDSTMNTLILTQ